MKKVISLLSVLLLVVELDFSVALAEIGQDVRARIEEFKAVDAEGWLDLSQLKLKPNDVCEILKEIGQEDCKKVTILDLSENDLSELSACMFSGLINLRFLCLFKNNMKSIEPFTFLGLGKLQILDLGVNRLRHLSPFTFYNLANLQDLCLELNQLSEFDQSLFKNLVSLQRLNFDWNEFRQVDLSVFYCLENLQNLSLYGNYIERFAPDIFGILPKLQSVVIGLYDKQAMILEISQKKTFVTVYD